MIFFRLNAPRDMRCVARILALFSLSEDPRVEPEDGAEVGFPVNQPRSKKSPSIFLALSNSPIITPSRTDTPQGAVASGDGSGFEGRRVLRI